MGYFSDEEWADLRRPGGLDRFCENSQKAHFYACLQQLRFSRSDRETSILCDLAVCTDPKRRSILELHLDCERLRQMRQESEEREILRIQGQI